MSHGPTDAEAVARAFDTTRARGCARVRVTKAAAAPAVSGPLGPIRRRLARSLADRMAEPVVATGVMDFARPRCALVYGAYAVLIDGDREWGGRPGRSIEELPPPRVIGEADNPLWPFASELTLGALAEARRDRIDERATDVATVAVRRGDAWTHLEVAVDVETGLLRRVAHVSDRRTLTIELLETAVHVADWSRLPAA